MYYTIIEYHIIRVLSTNISRIRVTGISLVIEPNLRVYAQTS